MARLYKKDAVGRVGIDGKTIFRRFVETVVQIEIDGIAIITIDSSEKQIAIIPITAQSVHAIAFAACHQPLGEEAGEMTHTTHDGAAEEVLLVTTYNILNNCPS